MCAFASQEMLQKPYPTETCIYFSLSPLQTVSQNLSSLFQKHWNHKPYRHYIRFTIFEARNQNMRVWSLDMRIEKGQLKTIFISDIRDSIDVWPQVKYQE